MSKIEWTEATWNPVAGCSIVSPGCTHCYAMKMAARIERMIPSLEHYKGLTKPSKAGPVWTGKVALAPERTLLEPLRRQRPTMWFVNSMSDLWHESVPLEAIIDIIAVMALTKRHTYQVLTKRAERQREVLSDPETPVRIFEAAFDVADRAAILAHQEGKRPAFKLTWPLPNVWWGTSTERQQEADERIPHLLTTPAAVRFVSLEPLLGPIDLTNIDHTGTCRQEHVHGISAIWKGNAIGRTHLDWVIVGGESGTGARPYDLQWGRDIIRQCQDARVPVFHKQVGSHPVDSARMCAPEDRPLRLVTKDKKGGNPEEWPPSLQVREMPTPSNSTASAA
jgi:protein gp37